MSYLSRDEIREKEEAKAAKRRRRKGYAEAKAALPLATRIETITPVDDDADLVRSINPVSEKVDADGFLRRTSKATGEPQEFAITPEAKAKRREEVFIRAGGKCELCAKPIYEGSWDLHHKRKRSLGGDWSMGNLIALCKYPEVPGVGAISCHGLMDRTDLIEKQFGGDPDAYRRYMEAAGREVV
jgi:hypothetical protein